MKLRKDKSIQMLVNITQNILLKICIIYIYIYIYIYIERERERETERERDRERETERYILKSIAQLG